MFQIEAIKILPRLFRSLIYVITNDTFQVIRTRNSYLPSIPFRLNLNESMTKSISRDYPSSLAVLAEARNSIMIFAETRAHSNPVVTSCTLPVLRARTHFMHKERVISKHRIFYTHRTYACFYLYSSYRNCVFQTHKRVFWPSQMFCHNRDENESIIENEVLGFTKA